MTVPKIPFARVDCSGNELAYVTETLRSGWLTTAGQAAAFEKAFAEAVDARHVLAVVSGTAALHLALEAAGVGPGDRVLVPSLTFTASAEVVRYLGADPVLVDVDYDTRLVTPALVRDALARTPNAKAAVPVHYGGQAAKMLADADGPGILDVCREAGVAVVEDAAHAFPARYAAGGPRVGSLPDSLCCFSFYANKTITTGEGGALATGDDARAKHLRVMRLHGIDRDVWDRFTSDKPAWEYDVVAAGYKYNLPDVLAAIGLAQLERADAFRAARASVARRYAEGLADVPGLDLPKLRPGVDEDAHAWHLYAPVLNERAGVDRNAFMARLAALGVGTSVHYKPLHRLTYYRERYGLSPEAFPGTERVWRGTFSLPIYPGLSDEDVARVVAIVRQVLA